MKKRDDAAITHVQIAMDAIQNDPEDEIARAMRIRLGIDVPATVVALDKS